MAGATGRRRLSRRAFLAGAGVATVAAGGLAVDQGVLPGRSSVFGHLGLDGPDGVVPQVAGGRTVSGSFVSKARRGRRCGWTIAMPPSYGSDTESSLPVAVVLHGRGGDHTSAFDDGYLGLDRFLAQAVGAGATPFAMASVDGGETYWHRRADGEDAGAMVVDELLPLLAEHGLDGVRVRVDCGEGDPFYAADRDYVRGFRAPPAGGFQRGGHDAGYWRRVAPHHVRFIAAAFAADRRT